MRSMGDWHFFEWRRYRIRDQKGLWVNSFFRMLAYSVMGVFAAIFVFDFGQEHFRGGGVENGLLLVMVFLLVSRLTVGVLGLPMAVWVIDRIGYRKSVVLSLVFSGLAFVSLSAVEVLMEWQLVLVAAVFFGLVNSTYWVTYHTLFSDDVEEEQMGKSVGLLAVAAQGGQMVAPLVGAGIALMFGYGVLFVSGLVLLMISGVPMLFLKRHVHVDRVSWGEFWQWVREWTFEKYSLSWGGKLLDETMREQLWPVYLFLMLGSLGSMGLLFSLVRVVRAGFTYLVAMMFDRGSRKIYQVIGVGGGMMMWLIRPLLSNFGMVIVVDSVDRFFMSLSGTFYEGYSYRRAKGKETFSFMVYRAVLSAWWLSLIYGLMIAVLWRWGASYFWPMVFGLGGLGLMLTLLVEEHHS